MSKRTSLHPALRSIDCLLELATTVSGGHPQLTGARLRLGVLLVALGSTVAPTGCIRTCYKPAPPPDEESDAKQQEEEAAAPAAEEYGDEEKEEKKEEEERPDEAPPAESEADPEQD